MRSSIFWPPADDFQTCAEDRRKSPRVNRLKDVLPLALLAAAGAALVVWLIARGGNFGSDDHKRTTDRQPKLAGDLPQTPLVEGSSRKQRVDQIRTS